MQLVFYKAHVVQGPHVNAKLPAAQSAISHPAVAAADVWLNNYVFLIYP